jgi:hypothetical protein
METMKYQIRNRYFSLHREDGGVIGKEPCWVLFYGGYAHYGSIRGILWEVLTEFKHDKHLAM